MIARTFAGRRLLGTRLFLFTMAMMAILPATIIVLGGETWSNAATAFEGEDDTVDAEATSDPTVPESEPASEPDPTESTLDPDPTATTPAVALPPEQALNSEPAAISEPTPVEAPAVELPASEEAPLTPVPTDETPDTADTLEPDEPSTAVRAAPESTTIGIGPCLPASGSTIDIDQGGAAVYTCVASVTVVQVPAAFAEIALDVSIVAEVLPSWSVELRASKSSGIGEDDEWTPGAMPGLSIIEVLGATDDTDGDVADETFSYEVRFDVRITAPVCGGPLDPEIALTPSVLPTIDGTPGWRRHGELYLQLRPNLAVAAPAPALTRTAVGDLDDADSPLRFSHLDQTVDAGTLELTVTSGYCGGWNISVSATDFSSESGDIAIGAENLSLVTTGSGPGAPYPAAALTLGNGEQSIISASLDPIPAGTYTYSFDLTLTVPGGTPPGTYISTVTVTASAAP